MNRFFITAYDIFDKEIELNDENAYHISNVLRLKVGDNIIVCNNNSTDFLCTIINITKGKVLAKIISKTKNDSEPNMKLTLFQGLPKSDKMELIIQKCVELGVHRIVPIITEFTVSKKSEKNDNKITRFRKISESAAKQCGRGIIPEIHDIISIKESLDLSKNLSSTIVAYEKEEQTTLKSFLQYFTGSSLGVYIGPEGGFSEKEINVLLENQIRSITLGKRILRTETAGLTIVANTFYELGE